MKTLSASFACLCLLLNACSSDATTSMNGEPSADGGSVGSGGNIGSGGSVNGGGSSGGSSNGMAGTNSGGANSNGGSNAFGGAEAGGNDSVGGSAASGGVSTGGSGSVAGSSAGGNGSGGGSAGGSGTQPPDIDYSIWVLQLPTGSGTSPTTISSSNLSKGYKDAYFYPGSDGGQTFMDPATGITTSGSQHCRTEMRESKPGGGQAAWSSSGTNTMTVTGKVLEVGAGAGGTVTVGQLFNGTDSIPLVELQYSTSAGGFKMLYEEAKGGGKTTDLKTPVALNERYTFSLALTKGQVTVTINGNVVHTQTPSASALSKQFYFKFGNYDQNASAGPITTTPYTIVEAYTVYVVHQ